MKAKKHISKKLLALLLSLLMVVTTIPMVVISSSAATGTVNPSAWQAQCGAVYNRDNNSRADDSSITINQ